MIPGDDFEKLHGLLTDAFSVPELLTIRRALLGAGDELDNDGIPKDVDIDDIDSVAYKLLDVADRRNLWAKLFEKLIAKNPRADLVDTIKQLGPNLESMAPSETVEAPPGPVVQRQEWLKTVTVLELDLVGYSTVATLLEENTGAQSVSALNQQIQTFVDSALTAVGQKREGALIAATGDGAILSFDRPDLAHRFAQVFHKAVRAHNDTRSAKRYFRMGAATGEVFFRRASNGAVDAAGTVISNAVRLEAAAKPGSLLIDVPTFEGLSEDQQLRYGEEESVPGKREETFLARRCVMDDTAPSSPSSHPLRPPKTVDRKHILSSLELLPPAQLPKLMFLLEMPVGQRPKLSDTASARRNAILDWAESNGSIGLQRLEAELRSLVTDPAENEPPPPHTGVEDRPRPGPGGSIALKVALICIAILAIGSFVVWLALPPSPKGFFGHFLIALSDNNGDLRKDFAFTTMFNHDYRWIHGQPGAVKETDAIPLPGEGSYVVQCVLGVTMGRPKSLTSSGDATPSLPIQYGKEVLIDRNRRAELIEVIFKRTDQIPDRRTF